MKLTEYYKALSITERRKFLLRLSVKLSKKVVTIRSYINGHRSIQAKHARLISEDTEQKVSLKELCPDVFEEAA